MNAIHMTTIAPMIRTNMTSLPLRFLAEPVIV
jgi:hypothetical protein